jgi:prepilin signal peptidase PulO-like enzyme (type II secretory pathway)
MLGVASIWFWCAAMLTPRRLWLKRGLVRAFQYLMMGILRYPFWSWIATASIVFPAVIGWSWWHGGPTWQALLSSLAGMAFGTAMVWSVRIVASRSLGKEALGFGDVTLMAMIGAFLGWQPTLMVFFIAPFAGVFIALGQWVLTRNPEIAYGPYLCLATAIATLNWTFLWERWGTLFTLGWLIPVILSVCLFLMALMLLVWRYLRAGSG